MKKYFLILGSGLFFTACSTTQYLGNPNDFEPESKASCIEEEEQLNEAEEKAYLIQEELKVQDVAETVIYVERPVYIPEEKSDEAGFVRKTGIDAVKESLKESVKIPENYKKGTFYYHYDNDFVYEVYAEPFHLTDIALQPGEVVIGTPLLSEDEAVWELTAGVGRDPETGEDVQHLFVKPAYSKLDSTLIIITDRRVYHFRLKSFSSTHMAMVKFTYPLEKNVWAKKVEAATGRSVENRYLRTSNPELLSFDYKIKYSSFKKPEFLPERVYDDGQRTYIQVNSIVLQKKLPVLFNEKNEILNYTVNENVFVIPRLVNKVTLRLGKEKVLVEKCITKNLEEVPAE